MRRALIGIAALCGCIRAVAAPFAATVLPPPVSPSAAVQPYVRVPADHVALAHVRLWTAPARPRATT